MVEVTGLDTHAVDIVLQHTAMLRLQSRDFACDDERGIHSVSKLTLDACR